MNFSSFSHFFDKGKTFRPKKKFQPGTLKYSLHKQAQASLNSGINLRLAVKLPAGEDYNDWLAVHVVDFFNRINLIYGTVCEQCTEVTCPTMSGGPKYEYLWQDGARFKKPTPLPASKYIALLMDWIESQINDETIFPVTTEVSFPKNFQSVSKKILTRLYRVFVHVYVHHFDRLMSIGAEPHVNTCYKHFYYFVTEFQILNEKELEPLKEMTRRICTDRPLPQPSAVQHPHHHHHSHHQHQHQQHQHQHPPPPSSSSASTSSSSAQAPNDPPAQPSTSSSSAAS